MGGSSDVLQTVRLPFSDQEQCKKKHENNEGGMHPASFCAEFVSGGFDSCQGDSGGPIVFQPSRGSSIGRLGGPMLTGVVSWGKGCALPDFAGVYTDVHNHLRWIEKIVLTKTSLFKE
jgi:secreted trypsin-like serine protease